MATATLPDHGTTARYQRKCRCDDCRAAKATHERERKRALGALPRDRHGTLAKFKRGCSCKECAVADQQYRDRAVTRTKTWREENLIERKTLDMAIYARNKGATLIEDVDIESLWTGFCALCSEPMDRDLPPHRSDSPTIDHIIPLTRGGQHTQDNLQWAHHGCNTRKGDR